MHLRRCRILDYDGSREHNESMSITMKIETADGKVADGIEQGPSSQLQSLVSGH